MNPKNSFLLLITVLALIAPGMPLHAQGTGPCDIPQGGIGGTGFSSIEDDTQPQSGIGGTGFSDPQALNGIGGTGKTEDPDTLGIQGVITGFGSICIGSTEVHYNDATAVQVGNQKATTKDLALGQVVKLTAENSSKGWVAGNIQVVQNMRGPLTKVGTDSFKIMNQKIHVAENTLNREVLEKVKTGESLAMSGFRQPNGEWVASRIDPIATDDSAVLTGPVTDLGHGKFRMGKTQVLLPDSGRENALQKGQQVRVVGQWDGKRLVAKDLQIRNTTPFQEKVRTVQVEGFLQDRVKNGQLRIDAYDIPLEKSGSALRDLKRNDFVKIRLRVDRQNGGTMRIDRIERLDRSHFDRPQRFENRGRGGDDKNGEDRHGGRGSDDRRESGSHGGRGSDDRPESGSHGGRSERPERPHEFRGSGSGGGRPDRIERPQRPERPERPDGGRHGGRDH